MNDPLLIPVVLDHPDGRGYTAYVDHVENDGCGHFAFLHDAASNFVTSVFTYDHPSDDPEASLVAFIETFVRTYWPAATIDLFKCHVKRDGY